MNILLASLLLLGTEPAPSVTVETATGNWDNLPQLQYRGTNHLNHGLITEAHEAAIAGGCKLPGQQGRELNLNLSFAAQFGADGRVSRILLPKMDCPRAEAVLGGALVEMINGGDYRPGGSNPEGWYQGVLRFSSSQ
jgi:hypothetical protein